jgi:hypothetical protein
LPRKIIKEKIIKKGVGMRLKVISLKMLSSPVFESFTFESYGLLATWITCQIVPSFLAFKSNQKSTEKICKLEYKLKK